MRLRRANAMLRRLLALFRERRIHMPRSVKVVHNTDLDARNKKRPRQIAQIELGYCFITDYAAIEASRAIERLTGEQLCGVLLHELAHVATERAKGDLEIAADSFIAKEFPDAGYTYEHGENLDGVPLRNLETVSPHFIEERLS